MSHESVEPGRAVHYSLPVRFSDKLRTREFTEFFRQYDGATFSVRTQDGWSWTSSKFRSPRFTATFGTGEELDSVLDDATEATLGRLFLDGGMELEGDILVLLSVAEYTLRHSDGLSRSLIQTIARVTQSYAKRLIPIHRNPEKHSWHFAPCPLDLPAAFFEPWLGSFLGHSCATFRKAGEDLETAQKNSFESACAWLSVERGDRFLDIGCGWGSFLLYTAETYGAYAQGITSSDLQSAVAIERICRRGMQRKCSVECRDLRTNGFRSEGFDKIAHLGVFEQVANPDLSDYLSSLRHLLVPGGMLLLHRLTRSSSTGTCITSLPANFLADGLSKELQLAEKAGFELLRVETLQSEYQDSLRVWIDNLLNARLTGTRVSSRGYRAWMLYLIELATCFNTGEVKAHRVLLRRSSAR